MHAPDLFHKILYSVVAGAFLILAGSYAFSKYINYREHNLHVLDTWLACVHEQGLSERAYEFCREKSAENYIIRDRYDWTQTDRALQASPQDISSDPTSGQ